MNIQVTREACCWQDDQSNRLQFNFELLTSMTIKDVARLIGESNFLQFSTPLLVIEAYSGELRLFSIPSLSYAGGKVEYFIEKTDLISNYLEDNKIEFHWPKAL